MSIETRARGANATVFVVALWDSSDIGMKILSGISSGRSLTFVVGLVGNLMISLASLALNYMCISSKGLHHVVVATIGLYLVGSGWNV